jgi:hypothetical protein
VGLVGETTFESVQRKAENFTRVVGAGDGSDSVAVGNTLKTVPPQPAPQGEDCDGQRHERMTRGTGSTTEGKPGRGESRRGERPETRLNPDSPTRIVTRSNAPKSRRSIVAADGQPGYRQGYGERSGDNGTGARTDDESARLCGGRNP